MPPRAPFRRDASTACRALTPHRVRLRQLHRDREPTQCQGMMNLTGLASVPSRPLAPFTGRLRPAVAAYLARFTGTSRSRTESDLRCYLSWCAERGLDPLAARRPHLQRCPLPPAVGRAIDRAVATRVRGPVLLTTRGARMDRHAATRRLHRLAEAAVIQTAVHTRNGIADSGGGCPAGPHSTEGPLRAERHYG